MRRRILCVALTVAALGTVGEAAHAALPAPPPTPVPTCVEQTVPLPVPGVPVSQLHVQVGYCP
jgi:hypothetical protein